MLDRRFLLIRVFARPQVLQVRGLFLLFLMSLDRAVFGHVRF